MEAGDALGGEHPVALLATADGEVGALYLAAALGCVCIVAIVGNGQA